MGRGYATLFSSFHTDSYVRGYAHSQNNRRSRNNRHSPTQMFPTAQLSSKQTLGHVAPRVSKGTALVALSRQHSLLMGPVA
jgi:hypothetical protein